MRIEDQLALESQRNETRRDWTVVALIAVVIAALTFGRSSLEIELIEQSHAALQRVGVPTEPLDIHFVGHKAILSGELQDQAQWDLVVDTVARAPGVWRVDASALQITGVEAGKLSLASGETVLSWDGQPPEPTTVAQWRPPELPAQQPQTGATDAVLSPMDPVLVAEIDNGVLTLTGLLPNDPAVTQMVKAAAESFGRTNVTNRIQTSPEIEPADWLHKVPVILDQARGIERIVLFFADEGIGMSEVSEENIARMQAARDMTRELPAQQPVAARSEAEPAPTVEPVAGTGQLRLRTGADGILLTGTLADPAQAEQLAEGIAAAFGRPVTDQIAIDPTAASPPWLSQLNQAWRILAQVEDLAVDVVGQEVMVSGRVASEQDRQVVAGAVRTILKQAQVVDRLEVVDWRAKAEALAEALTRRLGHELTFLNNQAELTAGSRVLLDQVASGLEANAQVRLGIGVHTDSRGTRESNRRLTQGRADRIRDYLVEIGIEPERLVAVGFGDARPVADNTTREGRAQNRRVEFFVPAGE